MNKSQLRSQLRRQRKNLSRELMAENSASICTHIQYSELWRNSQHIALYLPFNGEVNLSPLLQSSDKQLYLPAIEGNIMQFQLHQPNLQLHKHKFGIMQPTFIQDLHNPTLDLCLLPLLGFDLQGHRLGMGGGFYDRYFEPNKNTQLAGIAYQFQHIQQLPTDSWDVKLHHIFTEQGHHPI